MNIEHLPIAALIPYARNARTHSDAQVSQIAGSIREFGFTNPVLIGADNDIIAGHGRVMAARVLKLDTVPCIRLGHLNEVQRRAYVLADNRIALNSGWDEAMLALELTELLVDGLNLESLGFATDELDELLNGPDMKLPSEEIPEGKPAPYKTILLLVQTPEAFDVVVQHIETAQSQVEPNSIEVQIA
jgi:ParB-like chromosome segregation protein Spo0J